MKNLSSKIWLVAMILTAVSCKDNNEDGLLDTASEKDRMFMMKAADGGMFEVKAGELAVAKGDSMNHMVHTDSMSVRSFGQMMITDHTKANEELMALASRMEVALPSAVSSTKQQMIDSLSSASGADFNMMYAKMMVTSHQETVSLFEAQANDGDDAEVKSWAAGKLPTLRQHLEMAQMMRDSIR